MAQALGQQDAIKAVNANTNTRARWMTRLEQYVDGTQYNDRPGWFTDEVPLLERAPCIVYPAAKNAIRSTVSMVLGEGKFPRVEAVSDGDAADEASKADAEAFATFINGPLAAHSRLRAAARRLLRESSTTGTGVTVLCVRGGHLAFDSIAAKWSFPKFVPGGRQWEVESLRLQYPFIETFWNEHQKAWDVRAMIARRVIDAQSDTWFQSLVADPDGKPIAEDRWVPDTERHAVNHGLGFCPVIWYPHDHCGDPSSGNDGAAVHAELLDEIHALNVSLSQRHRASIYIGEPMLVESGVSDEDVKLDGSVARILIDKFAIDNGVDSQGNGIEAGEAVYMQTNRQPASPARRRGPGVGLRYTNADAKAELLSLPGDALKAIDDNARDLKSKLDESFSVVFLDPGNSALRLGELSGSAIKKLYMRQTSHCDEVREDFGDHALLPMVDMLLQLVAKLIGGGKDVYVRGLADVTKALSKCVADGKWHGPWLSLSWGEYFEDSSDDEANKVLLTSSALTSKLITRKTAVTKVASIFNVKDIEAEIEEIEEDADEHGSLESAQAAMKSEADKPQKDDSPVDAEDDEPGDE